MRRTEVGGLPVWWAPDPGPVRAGIAFRVGMADEPLALRGITHLAEHLALFELGRQPYLFNGTTGDNDTLFDVKGEPDEVLEFLHAVARGLVDPPLERFDDEVRILLAEGLTRSNGLATQLRQKRFGAQTYGLRGKRELGLRGLTPDDLQRWIRAHFTAENAVLWMTGEPPADLDLGLPAGERRPMPPADPVPRLVLPAYVREEDPVVAATFVASQDDAEPVRITASIARARLYDRLRRDCALVYDVDQGHGIVGAGRMDVRLSIDCREEDAGTVRDALLSTLDDLAGDGPTAEELAFEADQTRRYLEDPGTLEGRLTDAALDELFGLRPVIDDELATLVEQLTPQTCAQALRRTLETAIVVAPEALGGDPPPGLTEYAVPEVGGPPPEGREFRELDETSCPRRPCTVVVAHDELFWRAGDGSAELHLPFADVMGIIREAGDSHVLISRDDTTFDLSPLAFADGDALRDALVDAVGAERVIPLDARARRVEQLGEAQLSRREMLTEELYRVSRDITEDEEVVRLAEVEDNDGPGLVALTDRRLLWHYVARGAEDDEDFYREVSREDVSDVRADVVGPAGVLRFRIADVDGEAEIHGITPVEAAAELAEAFGGTVARRAPPAPQAAAGAEDDDGEGGGRARRVLSRLRSR